MGETNSSIPSDRRNASNLVSHLSDPNVSVSNPKHLWQVGGLSSYQQGGEWNHIRKIRRGYKEFKGRYPKTNPYPICEISGYGRNSARPNDFPTSSFSPRAPKVRSSRVRFARRVVTVGSYQQLQEWNRIWEDWCGCAQTMVLRVFVRGETLHRRNGRSAVSWATATASLGTGSARIDLGQPPQVWRCSRRSWTRMSCERRTQSRARAVLQAAGIDGIALSYVGTRHRLSSSYPRVHKST